LCRISQTEERWELGADKEGGRTAVKGTHVARHDWKRPALFLRLFLVCGSDATIQGSYVLGDRLEQLHDLVDPKYRPKDKGGNQIADHSKDDSEDNHSKRKCRAWRDKDERARDLPYHAPAAATFALVFIP
jgi:hypothetical protein